jgi:cytochrome c-type biogenesis protein CcmH
MLGAARFEAGDPIGAATAFRRALTIQPEDATSWSRLGESLVRAAEGEVQPDAEAAFTQALALDPNQLGARFFLGDLAISRGDVARARELWTPLIEALDPADPRRADLIARLDAAG